MTTADRLDEVFTELRPLNDEINGILFTPSGRPRRTLSEAKRARLDELMAQSKSLSREASRLVLEAA